MTIIAAQEAKPLKGCHILVVEDTFFIADDARRALEGAGAVVCGPIATLEQALQCVRTEQLDGAVLDVNLDGEMSYPIAEELEARGTPFIFATGYDEWVLPERWQDVKMMNKPYQLRTLVSTMVAMMGSGRGQ